MPRSDHGRWWQDEVTAENRVGVSLKKSATSFCWWSFWRRHGGEALEAGYRDWIMTDVIVWWTVIAGWLWSMNGGYWLSSFRDQLQSLETRCRDVTLMIIGETLISWWVRHPWERDSENKSFDNGMPRSSRASWCNMQRKFVFFSSYDHKNNMVKTWSACISRNVWYVYKS